MRRRILLAVLWVVEHPRTTLAVAAVTVALCSLLAWARLGISTDQNKQFSPRAVLFRDYLDFIAKFPENEAVYVVVEPRDPAAPTPPVARWTALADDIAGRLRGISNRVRSVDHRVAAADMGVQGLAFDRADRVRAALEEARRFVPLAKLWGEAPNAATALLGATPIERFLGAVSLQPPEGQTAGFVGLLADSMARAISVPEEPLLPGRGLPDLASLDAADPSRLGYYYVPDQANPGRSILLVRAYPSRDFSSVTALSETVDAIRREVSEANRSFPEFATGVTGRPALEADELSTTDRDARIAEVLALVTIFFGLVFMLRSVWLAFVTEIGLGVGIGWTFGWATLTVGELNLLSMVFLLALIGIGVDYLIQIVCRYRFEATARKGNRSLWVRVFRRVSAPINTTCAGAAGAFLVSAFTDFKGAAELGVIAGGGLFLCLLSGYTVVPAILTLFPVRPATPIAKPAQAPEEAPKGGRRRWLWPIVWVAALVTVAPFAMRSRFDPGLITLQAPNLESVKLVPRLDTWFAVVMSKSPEVLRACRDAVIASPLVGRTESILDAMDNQALLASKAGTMPEVAWTRPDPISAASVRGVAARARALSNLFVAPGLSEQSSAEREHASASLRRVADLLGGADADAPGVAARLSDWQAAFVDQLRASLSQFSPPPIDPAALPAQMRGHFRSDDGTYALYIYPAADLWNQKNLRDFVRDVDARMAGVPGAPRPTGIAPNIYHTTGAVERAFYLSTGLALALVFLLVVLDFRRLVPTLLAFSVLALGLPMLVALMGLLGVSWNFANFFGLPILIGAGHEYGVFLVHRWLEARDDSRRAWRAWDVSDKALLLCAFATCASFGYFWAVGHHLGLRSLGLVMSLGVGCIYLAALLVLRPILMMTVAGKRTGAAANPR